MSQASIQPSTEVAEVIQAFSAAWREGDVAGVVATLSEDASVLMSGPGAVPTVGRESVVKLLGALVAMNKGPAAGRVYFTRVVGWRQGDIGWGHAEGRLELPGKGKHHWNAALVVRREGDSWRCLQISAYAPIRFELMGTDTLGFIKE